MKPAPDTRNHQGLIITGIIISSLLLLFVLGAAAITSARIKSRRLQQEVNRIIEENTFATDSVYDGAEERPIDYSMVYTTDALASKEIVNADHLKETKEQLSIRGKKQLLIRLNEFEKRTNTVCEYIHTLRLKLDDTLYTTSDYGNSSLTIAFFATDNRSDQLLNTIKDYRDHAILQLGYVARPDQINAASNNLTLNDNTSSQPIGGWDESKFYDTPERASQYLLELETAVRYFEYDIISCYNN